MDNIMISSYGFVLVFNVFVFVDAIIGFEFVAAIIVDTVLVIVK